MSTLPDSPSNQNWFFTYKLYHIPFWLLYHYLWWVVAIGSPMKALSTLFDFPFTIKYSFYVVFQALAVYLNLYVLIPRFLEKNRFAMYMTYLLLLMLGTSLFIITGYYFSAYVSGRSLNELYGGGSDADCFYRFLGNALPSTVASMTLAMSIKLTKNWVQTRQRQQVLETEKLETELKFLKNQFNPHFLFNTINSIFFLIHKNPDMAAGSLAKFSELLRYQLYECNDHQIPLGKEITYLENFIELEKLRQNANVTITLDAALSYTDQLGIAPFMLMTFVENAFKHVSKHRDQPNWITIKIELTRKQLAFWVSNSTSPGVANSVVDYGGIGLKNVRRRLDLLYPGQYRLDIKHDPGRFDIKLGITLSDLVVTPALQMA